MTSLVGIYCKDGVVIGADSAVSLGDRRRRTIELPFDKIEIIDGSVILVCTGSVGMGQRLSDIVTEAWSKREELRKKPGLSSAFGFAKQICGLAMNDFKFTGAQYNLGALIAFPWNDRTNLFEYGIDDFQPERKDEKLWFSSMGCVQEMTDSLLAFLGDVFWSNENPTIGGGIFATKWTLDHVVKHNPGGVDEPVRIAVLEKTGAKFAARMVSKEELQEHDEWIGEIKKELEDFKNQQQVFNQTKTPPIPQPDALLAKYTKELPLPATPPSGIDGLVKIEKPGLNRNQGSQKPGRKRHR